MSTSDTQDVRQKCHGIRVSKKLFQGMSAAERYAFNAGDARAYVHECLRNARDSEGLVRTHWVRSARYWWKRYCHALSQMRTYQKKWRSEAA